jgi:hypothetical protein
MIIELREYKIKEGRRDDFFDLLQRDIIPYQIKKGMAIIGCFKAIEDEDLVIWLRRFQNEEERERLYIEVYESEFWLTQIKPQTDEMLDRPKMKVTLMEAGEISPIQ